MSERTHTRLWILAAAAGILVLAAVWLGSYFRAPRLTAEIRGGDLAAQLGCFACHGPGGTGGVPNPGSEEKEVPAWDGGTSMMYVQNESEIREWILYGRPERLAGRDPVRGDLREDAALPLHMPAYKSVIDEGELRDLVAYYKAVAAYRSPPAPAGEGYRVAKTHGCFGCHGPGGLVGAKNPRSFKGYIPPWRGPDFRDLVRDDDELHAWIQDGKIGRFESSRLARYFTRRQVIHMPAYRNTLADGEIESIVRYVHWLQSADSASAEAHHEEH